MSKNSLKKPPSSVEPTVQNIEDDIRARAYEMYEERGGEHGHDIDDWLRAEDEVRNRNYRAVAA